MSKKSSAKKTISKDAKTKAPELPENSRTYFEDAGVNYGSLIDTVFNMAGLTHVKPDVKCSYHYRDIGHGCTSSLTITFLKTSETVTVSHSPGKYDSNAEVLKTALEPHITPKAG